MPANSPKPDETYWLESTCRAALCHAYQQRSVAMKEQDALLISASKQTPWNKGKFTGAKPPLRAKHVWSIRSKLLAEGRIRDLAMFNLAIDSKLRACDVVALKAEDVAPNFVSWIGRTRLGQRTSKCVLSIGTQSAQSIRASGTFAASTGRTRDRTRPMLQDVRKFLPRRPPHVTQSGHWLAFYVAARSESSSVSPRGRPS